MKSRSFSPQAGLTLLEMVIGLSVIVLVLVLAITSFDQNSGRAQSLEAKMQLVRAGVLRFQTDLPCGPATLSALTVREDAAVGLCGDSNNLNNWHGPYIDSGSTYVNNGDLDISNILPGSSLSITKVVGSTIYTILNVSAISDEMRSAVVALCADDCTPYKKITGDADKIGILVSGLTLQTVNQGGDLVAFGATPAVSTGSVVSLLAIQPPTFVPPAITMSSSTIAPYSGPSALLVMAPTLTQGSPQLPSATAANAAIAAANAAIAAANAAIAAAEKAAAEKAAAIAAAIAAEKAAAIAAEKAAAEKAATPAPGITVTVSGINVFPSVQYPAGTIFQNLTVSGHFQVKNSEIRNFNTSGNTFVNTAQMGNVDIAGNFFAINSSIANLTVGARGGGIAYLKNTNIQNLDFRGYGMVLTNSTISAGRVVSPYGANPNNFDTINADSINIASGVQIGADVLIVGKNLTIWGVNYGPCEVVLLGGKSVQKTTCPGGTAGFDARVSSDVDKYFQ